MARRGDQPYSSSAVTVCLEESDIEGAVLDEPLETKTILQLRWWLTCHGVESPSNEKRATLITWYIYFTGIYLSIYLSIYLYICPLHYLMFCIYVG